MPIRQWEGIVLMVPIAGPKDLNAYSVTVVSYRTPSGTGTGTWTPYPWLPLVRLLLSTARKAV
jgi:hypothetical protein